MITRIVKLKIKSECAQDFKAVFDHNQEQISNQPGCFGTEVLRDIKDNTIFFTYSTWENEKSLNDYRNSELFGQIWPTVKKMFAGKPEAWSLSKEN